MQHKSDIEGAIAKSRVTEIEDAFRALVDWPRVGMIKGIHTTDEATALLKATADALVRVNDKREMPRETADFIESMSVGPEMMMGDWYAAGALFVRDRLPRWRPSFISSFGESGVED